MTFEPPVKKGRFTYDDKKFFESLRKQALGGKALSEKQTAALAKMAGKYRGELTDPARVDAILGAEPGPEGENSGAETVAVAHLLEELGKVTQWAEPVRKGRYTYDDKVFFESLVRQYSAGGRLSAKQQAALAKMAAKYGVKE